MNCLLHSVIVTIRLIIKNFNYGVIHPKDEKVTFCESKEFFKKL